MASVEQNIATSKKFADQISKDKSFKWIKELVSPNYQYHDTAMPNLPKGAEGLRQFLQVYVTAFPDLKLTITDAFGAGDKVAWRWLSEGTNTGSLMGNPPTGKKVSVEGITIDTYDADGKVVESYNSWDSYGLMVQLGLVPEAAAEKTEQPEQRPGVQ